MKLIKLSAAIFLIVLTAISTPCQAQEQGPDEAEMMKKWEAFATPGPEHKRLEYKVGKWNFTITMWMAPEAPPSTNKGTAEIEMIMGGRYLLDHTKSEFNGMPFEGQGLTGYNNLTKKYITLWIDSMGTGFMPGEGTFDAGSNEWNYQAEMPDPMTGKKTKTRSIEKIVDDDHWTMTMYGPAPDGSEFKSMEIKYTREK